MHIEASATTVCVCVLSVVHTCEQRVVVQTSLLVSVRTHVEQVGLDGPVDEVCGEVEQHDPDHHHHDGPGAPGRAVADVRCKTESEAADHSTMWLSDMVGRENTLQGEKSPADSREKSTYILQKENHNYI